MIDRKVAPLQLCSPPAEEAKAFKFKEKVNTTSLI